MNPSVWKPNEMEKTKPERERKKATSPMKWILRDIRSPHSAVHAFTLVHTYTHTAHPTAYVRFFFLSSPEMHWRSNRIRDSCSHVCGVRRTKRQKTDLNRKLAGFEVCTCCCCDCNEVLYQEHTVRIKLMCMSLEAECSANEQKKREKKNWLNKNRNVFMAVHAVQKGEIEWERKKMTPNRKSKTHRERKMSRLLRWNSKCECISIQKNWN